MYRLVFVYRTSERISKLSNTSKLCSKNNFSFKTEFFNYYIGGGGGDMHTVFLSTFFFSFIFVNYSFLSVFSLPKTCLWEVSRKMEIFKSSILTLIVHMRKAFRYKMQDRHFFFFFRRNTDLDLILLFLVGEKRDRK